MHQDSPWKLVMVVVILLFFGGMGIAHVINPGRFIRSSGVRKGGEVLEKWNRDSFRLFGAVFAAFAIFLLYVVLRDYLAQR
jgi:hypothetical protein